MPRASALTVIVPPWSTGPPGRVRESGLKLVIQVERSPRPERSCPPVTVRSPTVVLTTAEPTRPDAAFTSLIPVTGVPSFSPFRATTSVTVTGPQLWTGEIVLCGSSTETR